MIDRQARGRQTSTKVALLAALVGAGLCLTACSSGPSPRQQAQSQAAEDAADQAVAHVRLGDPEAALAEFERAIELNPLLTRAYVGAGLASMDLDDAASAEQYLTRAVRLDPNNPRNHFHLGRALQMLGRVSDSIRAYLTSLELDPTDPLANINVSVAYMQAEEPSRARPFAERAVFLDPNSAPARINLGSIYAAMDEHRRAVDEYQQAAELVDPISPELLVNLAESLRSLGEDAQVINVLDQLLRTNESALAWERRGAAMFRLGDYDGATSSFEQALEIDAEHYPALNGLAVLRLNQFIQSENTDTTALQQALENFRKSLRIEHRQPKVRELLSRFS
ncbi:MAG: tetratricopeptide repeat protein [Phycisphaera sp.]|nr:MAG: tetratricopeptide repeat protein [Phycisphaera sp.]